MFCFSLVRRSSGWPPHLWKLDIDSAFRRVPLAPDDRWASAVAFIFEGEPHVSTHFACPFGATSSVHSWERVGALVTSGCRRLLKIATWRYVDDLFGAER